jgi:hypothetical protein
VLGTSLPPCNRLSMKKKTRERSKQGTGRANPQNAHGHGDRGSAAHTTHPCRNPWPIEKRVGFTQGPRRPSARGNVLKHMHSNARMAGPRPQDGPLSERTLAPKSPAEERTATHTPHFQHATTARHQDAEVTDVR